MDFKNIKLIVSDLDGTLFNSQKVISEENKRAVRRVQEEGVLFTFATGRADIFVKETIEELELELPVIVANGAYFIEKGRRLDERLIDSADLWKMFDAATEFDANLFVSVGYDIYAVDSETNLKIIRGWGVGRRDEKIAKNVILLKSYDEMYDRVNGRTSKLFVRGDDYDKNAKVRARILETCDVTIANSAPLCMDIMRKGVSKANAIRVLAEEKLGVRMDEVMALGDQENDMPMLKAAGYSVAMGNGVDFVKREADFVTKTNDENGVAYALDQLIINRQ